MESIKNIRNILDGLSVDSTHLETVVEDISTELYDIESKVEEMQEKITSAEKDLKEYAECTIELEYSLEDLQDRYPFLKQQELGLYDDEKVKICTEFFTHLSLEQLQDIKKLALKRCRKYANHVIH